MRNVLRFALLAVLLLPARAVAWGGEGHRILCGVAYQRLTPEARVMATRLLGSGDEKVFVDACVWADSVRDDRPETYNYHFINTPAGMEGPDMARDCGDPARRCAPWAIVHYGRILANPQSSAIERSDAIKFVMHFIGDLHQPLHAGRPGDLGGNRVYVDFFGDSGRDDRKLNLHSVWDSQILRRAERTWPTASQILVADIAADEAQRWETLDVLEWTNESYRICEDFVYGQLPADGRIRNFYYRPALGYVHVQLQKGGVRLAHFLNKAATGNLNLSI